MRRAILFSAAVLTVTAGALADDKSVPVEMPVPDITVSADAWAWNGPDTLRVNFLVEGSGAFAADAVADVKKKETSVGEAVQKLGLTAVSVQMQEERFSSGDRRSETLSPGSAIRAERLVGVETASVDRAAAIVDAVLKNGASSILDVDYLVRNPAKNRAKAIEEATAAAKAQAEQTATALGVKLGPLLTIGVTEEPEGKTLRLKRARGEDEVAEGSDRETRWSVSLRYGITQ